MGPVRRQARSIDSPGGIRDATEEPIHAVGCRGSCQIRSYAAESRLIDVANNSLAVDFGGVGGRGETWNIMQQLVGGGGGLVF
jgi:hypothetical protein